MMAAEPVFTRAEVKAHNTPRDCWIIYAGHVYALPPDFIYKSHPGGPYIMGCAGSDATTTFDDGPHNITSREILAMFKIGRLARTSTGSSGSAPASAQTTPQMRPAAPPVDPYEPLASVH